MKNSIENLNADIPTILKARGYGAAMEGIFQAKPEMDIQENHVRLYYNNNELTKAQSSFNNMLKPGNETDVKVDVMPIMVPVLVKKYWLHLLIAGAAFYYISKNV